jgi:hypothetical protein
MLDLSVGVWHSPMIQGEVVPKPRSSHSAVAYGHKIIIFGGHGGITRLYNDVWAFDTGISFLFIFVMFIWILLLFIFVIFFDFASLDSSFICYYLFVLIFNF